MNPADQPLSAQNIAADLFQLLIYAAGAFLLAKQIYRERGRPPAHLRPWSARWVDFGLWVCVIVFTLSTAGMVFSLFYSVGPDHHLSNFETLLLGGVSQVLVLVVQLGLLQTRSVLSFAPVNAQKLPFLQILKQGALAFVAAYPLVILAGYVSQFVLEALQHAYPQIKLDDQTVVQLISHGPDLGEISLTMLFAGALAPVNEELLFRAGLYRFLKGKFSVRVALGLASLLFAAAHFNLLQFAPLFVVGWMLARAYERSGNIGVPMVFHALFNLNTIVMVSFFSG